MESNTESIKLLEELSAEKRAEFLSTSCRKKTKYYKLFGELTDLEKKLKAEKIKMLCLEN